MATKKYSKSARGTKAEGSVRLGSEFLTREEYNARFPICKMAQDVINALRDIYYKLGEADKLQTIESAQQ